VVGECKQLRCMRKNWYGTLPPSGDVHRGWLAIVKKSLPIVGALLIALNPCSPWRDGAKDSVIVDSLQDAVSKTLYQATVPSLLPRLVSSPPALAQLFSFNQAERGKVGKRVTGA